MASDEAQDDAAVFDFLDEFLRDLERGTRLPLTHYLARYKGHEEAVGAEYFAELARAGLAGAPKPNGAATESFAADTDPERVGPYRLLRELGRGGQGAVWLAEDTRIARHVALKLLPAEFAALSTERRKRLQREAEVIARLDHPCLCAVLDARIDGERPYIAMRFVEGGTLGEAIVRAREARQAEREGKPAPRVLGPVRMAPRTPLELAGLLTYFERAARALHAAHEAGVVHRDVKPQNLMVTRAGDPVVLDFGQARDETSDSFELTRSGDVLGTPAYMSPEQILGVRKDVDRRTDVWSLGASLYEALTLSRAFAAESVPALFMAIRGASVPDPRALNRALPADLSLVVATALEKEPKLRYANALEFAEDLRRVREYEPVRAKPPSAWRVFQSWFQRHPAVAYGTLGSIVALSIGLASTLYLLDENRTVIEENRTVIADQRGLLLGYRADKLIEADPSAALAWGIEAVKAVPAFDTRAALFRALQACHLRSMIDAAPAKQALDCATSPDGRSVAMGFDDGAVSLCDLESGKVVLVVRPHPEPPKESEGSARAKQEARDVEFSPDGSRLAFVVQQKLAPVRDPAHQGKFLEAELPRGRAFVVDARTAEGSTEIELLPGEARSAAFVAEGRTLIALSDSGAVAVDARDGHALWRWDCPEKSGPDRETRMIVHAAADRALLWIADESKLAASSAWLLDTMRGIVVRQLDVASGFVSAEFRADGLEFVTGSDDGTLRSWSAKDGELERRFDQLGAPGAPRTLRYSPDGTRVVALLEDGSESRASMVYLASGAPTLIGTVGVRVAHAAFSPDGLRIATIGADMIVRLWAGTDNHEEQSFRGGLFTPRRIEWTSDGRRLVILSNVPVPCVSVWYAGALPDVYALRATESPVRCARFAPDGERVVVGSDDGMARVWATPASDAGASKPTKAEAGELLFSLGHRDAVRDAVYSPDGKWIATASDDGTARLWSASSGMHERALIEGATSLSTVTFSHDGAFVAVRSDEGRVFLCDPTGARATCPLDTLDAVTALAWLPTRAQLVTAHEKNVLRIFEASDGALLETRTWEGEKTDAPTGAVALSVRGDGAEVALACADSRARFFGLDGETKALEPIKMITAQSIEFSRDGNRLLVTGRSGKGAIRLQNLAQARQAAEDGQATSKTEATGEIGMDVLHSGDVTGGALSPDGRWMITTAKSGGAYVRDTTEGTPFVHFRGPIGASCFAPAISPGERTARALVAFDDGSVWIWPLDPLPAAVARKPRELNQYELEKERKERERRPGSPAR